MKYNYDYEIDTDDLSSYRLPSVLPGPLPS